MRWVVFWWFIVGLVMYGSFRIVFCRWWLCWWMVLFVSRILFFFVWFLWLWWFWCLVIILMVMFWSFCFYVWLKILRCYWVRSFWFFVSLSLFLSFWGFCLERFLMSRVKWICFMGFGWCWIWCLWWMKRYMVVFVRVCVFLVFLWWFIVGDWWRFKWDLLNVLCFGCWMCVCFLLSWWVLWIVVSLIWFEWFRMFFCCRLNFDVRVYWLVYFGLELVFWFIVDVLLSFLYECWFFCVIVIFFGVGDLCC